MSQIEFNKDKYRDVKKLFNLIPESVILIERSIDGSLIYTTQDGNFYQFQGGDFIQINLDYGEFILRVDKKHFMRERLLMHPLGTLFLVDKRDKR